MSDNNFTRGGNYFVKKKTKTDIFFSVRILKSGLEIFEVHLSRRYNYRPCSKIEFSFTFRSTGLLS